MDRCGDLARPEAEGHLRDDFIEGPPRGPDPRIHGQEDPDVMTPSVQLARKRGGNVPQTARFRERKQRRNIWYYVLGTVGAFELLEATLEALPSDRPRYLMGVGHPLDLSTYARRGVDTGRETLNVPRERRHVALSSRREVHVRPSQ